MSNSNVTPHHVGSDDPPTDRKPLPNRLIASLLTLVLAIGGGSYFFQQRLLPHVETVKDGVLYRSGQPRGLGLNWVKLRGIHTLVNLRGPDSDGVAEEQAFAARHGIEFVQIPMGTDGYDLGQSADQFLDIVADEANWPILVHCSRGKERAGIMSALYRIQYDQWPILNVVRESIALGLDPQEQPAAYRFIEEFARTRATYSQQDSNESYRWTE